MPRNLRNRIEQCVPIEDENLKRIIFEDLNFYLADNTSAWLMLPDGQYVRTIGAASSITEGSDALENFNAQEALLQRFSESR